MSTAVASGSKPHPSDVPIYGSGTIDLPVGAAMTFRNFHQAKDGTLLAGDGGIVGGRSTQFWIVPPALGVPTFETCRDQRFWKSIINWDEIGVGSWMCIKVFDGRRGAVHVERMPELGSDNAAVRLTGQVWEPILKDG